MDHIDPVGVASRETCAGGVAVHVGDGGVRAAVIGRRTPDGAPEWCLPKGHLERGESPERAAVREVAEETGIVAEIVAPLGAIDYRFTRAERHVHKVVHHFLLRASSDAITAANDPDHEAEAVAWVPLRDLPARLTYPDERRVAERAIKLLARVG